MVLRMELIVRRFDLIGLSRIVQLINKTNQFEPDNAAVYRSRCTRHNVGSNGSRIPVSPYRSLRL